MHMKSSPIALLFSVTKIAASTIPEGMRAKDSESPGRVVGIHFFNPVPVMVRESEFLMK
jgi:3-hydroxyacyl-CoA dehydrogenase